ncbi:IS110 family transposase [Thermodesulfovibrio yellowstonii]|uniref:IS110 family transposase n=1 Tax=Thermodesulfovibrio yellowstonii TaxID=28262 RepID=A0A9W6GEI1_9BACT|nr:IS110 family transposase [Thermodesulfovibrio islandicus]GLI52469.1 IS110 family transposase [Thermodesulfovibrio islandicus]GLI52729.1 IS110 family transposase [Thermodesulfovibrio islandicus]GLI52936.1 IS110 family transposase [Thermodesulfovibrio islandicus]GLI53479.1 IS110 family transposase [Thermodesulfovibrio islandicus]
MSNFKVFVGIDISKESFSACAISSPQDVIFEDTFPMDSHGFKAFIRKLNAFPKNSILIGKESSGCYYINLFVYLSKKNFNCVVLNPLIVKGVQNMEIRKTKTDRSDARRIAFALYTAQYVLPQKSFLSHEFRELARERERITQQIATLKNDIEKALAVLFPELERRVNIYTESILRVLEKYPSAWALKAAPLSDIQKIISSEAGRASSVTAESLKKWADNSIGQFFPVRELILQGKIRELFFLEEQLERVTELLKKSCEEAALCQNIEILKSIKGIGDTTAMHFIAEVGDISRFSSPKKLIAYAGLDPTVYESGKFKGSSRLSKRGNRHLRRVIWLMAVGVVIHNEYFRQYFKRRRTQGLPYKKAMLAVAHKLMRTIYAMLKHKKSFSLNHSLSPCM